MVMVGSVNQVPPQRFLSRFLGTQVKDGTAHLPAPAEDQVSLSGDAGRDMTLALRTAAKIQELAGMGMGGALPVMISAAILRSDWTESSPPSLPVIPQENDPNLMAALPNGFVEEAKGRVLAVADKLSVVGGQHAVEFCVNRMDAPAAANGDQVWINVPIAAQVFASDDLLAFALAHEKGHIAHGDTSWEPKGTELLWNVMTEAFQKAEQSGDSQSAAALDAGIVALERSFEANAHRNEIEADLAAISMVEAAGFDRKPGLAFLLNTAGDTHHPPGPQRVQAIRQHLEDSDRAISDKEMVEILEMTREFVQNCRLREPDS